MVPRNSHITAVFLAAKQKVPMSDVKQYRYRQYQVCDNSGLSFYVGNSSEVEVALVQTHSSITRYQYTIVSTYCSYTCGSGQPCPPHRLRHV